jgi:hypothetical protein
MSIGRSRSRLTSAGSAREHHALGRPRIQLEFSSAGRRRSSEPDILVIHPLGLWGVSDRQGADAGPDDAVESSPFFIEVFFKAVSAAVAAEGATKAVDALGPARPDAKSLKLRLNEALDVDLAISLGQAKNTPKGYAPLVRLLKSWTKKSGNSRRLLIEHVLDATLDPLTWRTAHEDVGPRPKVNVLLVVPGSYAATTTIEPLQDIGIAIVYRGAARAAEEVEELAEAMTPHVAIPSPAVVLQARRNAEARATMLEEFGALTAADVADLAGSDAKNTSALAGRWRREGRLLAVEHHGTVYYPGFQFDSSGKPRPEIAQVLRYLSAPERSQRPSFTKCPSAALIGGSSAARSTAGFGARSHRRATSGSSRSTGPGFVASKSPTGS